MFGGGIVALMLACACAMLQAQVPAVTQQDCGGEGQVPCAISLTNAACDTGLRRSAPANCGCLVTGPFGGCLIPRLCTTCVNHTRRRSSINTFHNSWIDWALRNQRDLAQDEPVNWVMRLGTHNSFNSTSDGHDTGPLLPNQFYSMTDQLRSGARVLSIDLFQLAGDIRLCHGGGPDAAPALCAVPGVPLIYPLPPGLRYFSQGIKEIRNWLSLNPDEIIFISLENWAPTMGASHTEIRNVFRAFFGNRTLKSPLVAPAGFTDTRWPTAREMGAARQQVIIMDDDAVAANEFVFKQQDIVGSFGDEWAAKNVRRYPNCVTDHVLEQAPVRATITVEEREFGIAMFGLLDAGDVADAAECNYSFIVLDKFSSFLPHPPGADLFDYSRQMAAIWSWNVGDVGQHGACAAVESTSGRWRSANCGVQRQFACARPRSEAGLDPLAWEDRLGEDWKITAASGPWTAGQSTCAAEFPGYNFSVPVNGYQNRKLKDLNAAASDLWVNYSQREVPGQWAIGRLPAVGAPPIAAAGPDQTVECGFTATLDGSASKDPQGDPLTYTWSGPFGTLSGAVVTATLPPGEHAITLTVSDGKGGTDTDSVTITVNDTTSPTMTVALSPWVLWPPNHKPVSVVADVQVHDTCDAEPPSVELISVVSDESGNGRGAGQTLADVVNADIGTDDREFGLRAEREGAGRQRTYTATYRATDLAGNKTEVSAKVVAPHDRGKK
jgi:hypothetical protein